MASPTGGWRAGMPQKGGGWRGDTTNTGGVPNPNQTPTTAPPKAVNRSKPDLNNRNTVAYVPDQPAPQGSFGSESGPGILESWFNQRAAGTDPAYQYTMGRGMDAIDSRMAAGGSYNSGARGQQLSDFASNMGAHRMGQLDTLAGGASGEHLGRLGMMMNQRLGLASGMAGAGTAYDTAAAGGMSESAKAQMMLALQKAGVDAKAAQALINNFLAIASVGNAGGGGGGNSYYNAGNPYPV